MRRIPRIIRQIVHRDDSHIVDFANRFLRERSYARGNQDLRMLLLQLIQQALCKSFELSRPSAPYPPIPFLGKPWPVKYFPHVEERNSKPEITASLIQMVANVNGISISHNRDMNAHTIFRSASAAYAPAIPLAARSTEYWATLARHAFLISKRS